MLEERKRTLTLSPSFREEDEEEDEGDRAISAAHHGSPQQISAVPALPDDSRGEVGSGSGGGGSGDDDDDFEFSFAIADPDSAAPAITADEIFSDGRIRPVYPVFDRSLLLFDDDDDDADPPPPPSSSAATAAPRPGARLPLGRLLMEERNSSVGSNSSSSSSSSSAAASEPGELEGVAPETYCLWTPGSAPNSPARCRKSGSTGSIVRWRRISDLVIGRSRSDGKEKFLFLRNPNPNPLPKAEEAKEAKGKERKGGKVTEADTVTAHRVLYYGKGAKGGRRASFLPYKQDLVGIFANVNGVSRAHHHPL